MDISNLFDAHTHFHEGMDEGHSFVLSGYSFKSNMLAMQKVANLKNAYFSLGLGPQEIQRSDIYPDLQKSIDEIISQMNFASKDSSLSKKFVAIGEVGLDSHWGKSTEHKERQFEAFEKMISISKKLNKPLVIHSRDAEKECIQQLHAADCKKVMMHCFGGKFSDAKICADAGWLISIAPQKNSQRKKIIKSLPLESLVVESDAPYIAKTSAAGARLGAKMIAEYRQISEQEASDATFANAKRLFGI